MKERFSKKTLKFWCLIILFASVCLLVVIHNLEALGVIFWLINVIEPLIIGGCIAFVLNLIMKVIGNKVLTKKLIKKEGLRQTLCLLLSVLILFLILIGIIAIVVPQLIHSIELLSRSVPEFLSYLREEAQILKEKFPDQAEFFDQLNLSSQVLSGDVISYLRDILPRTISQTYQAASETVGVVFSVFIGIMFSFYILLSKKQLMRQFRQLCYTYLSQDKANKLLYIFHLTNENFNAFIYGQCLEAVILFIMYLAVAFVFRVPYAFMIATMIAVFSLIPLFGAYIGWGIGVFLILTVNPWQVITFTIIFFVISQIEGNLIYPRIVGNSIGLPGIWVLAAVTVGGNMFGIVGMIMATPIVALIYTLLSEDSYKRLKNKPKKIEEIEEIPNWKNYNPETSTFDNEPYRRENIFEEE